MTDAVLLHPNDFAGRYSVGLVDEQLVFSYVGLYASGDRAFAQAQWFDAELSATTEPFWLGDSTVLPAWEWVAFEGRAWAQIWAVPTRGELPLNREQIAIYALTPGSVAHERIQRDLPISTINDDRRDLTPVSIGASWVTSGRDARAPSAIAHGRPVFALNAIPAACVGGTWAASSLFVFDATAEQVNLWPDAPCDEYPDRAPHDASLVGLADGGVAALFRLGSGGTLGTATLRYSRVGEDLGLLDWPPNEVGSTQNHYPIPGGYQPRAAQVDGGPILFTERTEEHDYNMCSNLRLVDADGTAPRAAAWQLPCYLPPGSRATWREPQWMAPTLSAWMTVEPLASGHVALTYGERTSFPLGYEYLTPLTTEVAFEEGVFLTTLDGQGRRASEIVRVTPDEATALTAIPPRTATEGPYPADFEVQTAAEGDVVAVVWRDLRPDAPGYYGRRFRCAPLTAE